MEDLSTNNIFLKSKKGEYDEEIIAALFEELSIVTTTTSLLIPFGLM